MKPGWKWIAFVVGAFLLFLGGCSSLLGKVADLSGNQDSFSNEPYIGLVKIEGPIFTALPVLNQFRKLQKDYNAKGILLRIDSPGGAVGASQEIFRGVQRLIEDSIPVVVSCGNLAASGGLYSLLAADRIFVNSGTLTGSIGVITQFPQADKLLDKVGLKFNTIKSGALKDAGNPYRGMNTTERAYIQKMVNTSFALFKEDILKSRPIDKKVLDSIADGRVLNGVEAVAVGLADTLGNFQDAHEYLSEITGVSYFDPLQEALPPKSFFEELSEPLASLNSWLEQNASVRLPMYMWN